MADWGLVLEAKECANVPSKSAAAAKGCVFGDSSENQVQRCDSGRSKVVHLFPELGLGCHHGWWFKGPGPTLSMSSLALVVAAVTLDLLNEVLASQSAEMGQCQAAQTAHAAFVIEAVVLGARKRLSLKRTCLTKMEWQVAPREDVALERLLAAACHPA